MLRGEIYWAEFEPRSGSEQQGHRPAIVVSHNGFNQTQNWNSVIVVPISSSRNQARRSATIIELEPNDTGLTMTSFAICHQITTLDRRKFGRRIGVLSKEASRRIERGMLYALAIEIDEV